jgi:predicted ABC-type ATPase
MRLLVVIAGPNGSGKSTLVAEVRNSPHFPQYYFCPDEIVKDKQFSHIPDINQRYIAAMREAELLRRGAIDNGLSLAFETVFSTPEKLQFLHYAKDRGYYIELIFITTRDPLINIERVAQRVASGGHDVSRDKILTRYERSMKLLPGIIQVADTVKVYDNSEETPFIVFFKRVYGDLVLLNKEKRSDWVEKYILDPLIECGFLKERPIDLDSKATERYIENAYTDRIQFVKEFDS